MPYARPPILILHSHNQLNKLHCILATLMKSDRAYMHHSANITQPSHKKAVLGTKQLSLSSSPLIKLSYHPNCSFSTHCILTNCMTWQASDLVC